MKTAASVALLVLSASMAAAASDPIIGKPVPSFTAQLIDVSAEAPRTTPFDSTTAKDITAYLVIGVNCPATRAYADRMSELQKVYGAKDIDFIYVYSNREDTLDAKIGFHREEQLGGKLIDDKGGEVAKKFGAKRTSEIFVVNKEKTIVYHGAVDDSRDAANVKQRYLQTALDETLAGVPVTVSSSPVQA